MWKVLAAYRDSEGGDAKLSDMVYNVAVDRRPNPDFGYRSFDMAANTSVDVAWSVLKSDGVKGGNEEGGECGFNPARVPPRVYIACSLCRDAICQEIDGLLTKNSPGASPLCIVHRKDAAAQGLKMIRSALAARMKTPGKMKERLRIRGDLVPSRVHASSPTPNRSCLRSFLALSRALNCKFDMVDSPQAFAQSANVDVHERYLIRPQNVSFCPGNVNSQRVFPASR